MSRPGAQDSVLAPPALPTHPPTHHGQDDAEEGDEEEGSQDIAHQRVARRARGRGGRGVAHGPAPASLCMGTRVSGPAGRDVCEPTTAPVMTHCPGNDPPPRYRPPAGQEPRGGRYTQPRRDDPPGTRLRGAHRPGSPTGGREGITPHPAPAEPGSGGLLLPEREDREGRGGNGPAEAARQALPAAEPRRGTLRPQPPHPPPSFQPPPSQPWPPPHFLPRHPPQHPSAPPGLAPPHLGAPRTVRTRNPRGA